MPGYEVPWLQPFPDELLSPARTDPAVSTVERSRLRLALVAAMQLLPARPRAVLILRDVLDLSAAEVAELLEMTTPAVNSALQRARRRLDAVGVDPDTMSEPDVGQRAVVDRYVAAFERADVAQLTRLLADDVVLEMPPMWNWYTGRAAYGGFLARVWRTRGTDCRMRPVAANGQPAVAAYAAETEGVYALRTLQVFTVEHGVITRTTVFQDPDVFAIFGLSPTVPRNRRRQR